MSVTGAGRGVDICSLWACCSPNASLVCLHRRLGLNFPLTEIEFGIFGFLLVLVMILRPQGLIPERRRRLELTSGIAAEDAQLVEGGTP